MLYDAMRFRVKASDESGCFERNGGFKTIQQIFLLKKAFDSSERYRMTNVLNHFHSGEEYFLIDSGGCQYRP